MRELLVVPSPESYETRASALRARGIVVLLQLAQLHHTSHALDLAATPFATVEEFAAHILGEIGRTNAMWVGSIFDARAILRAEARFSEIGADPRVAAVLTRGIHSTDPHVRLTCATLRTLLNQHELGGGSSTLRCASSQEN